MLLFSVIAMLAKGPLRLLRSRVNMHILSDTIHSHTRIEYLVDQNVLSEVLHFKLRHVTNATNTVKTHKEAVF